MINNKDANLIDVTLWQVLHQQHAKEKFNIFSANLFKDTPKTVAVFCGDANRLEDVINMVRQAAQEIDLFISADLTSTIPDDIHFQLASQFSKHYEYIIDVIAAIDTGALLEHQLEMIDLLNKSQGVIIALDCPSGLNPNTGEIRQGMVHAHATLSRYAYLQGLFAPKAKDFVGQLELLTPSPYLIDKECLISLYPKRNKYVSKGSFRRVKVIAGQAEMFGASVLAAYAALVMGAGLVEVYYPSEITPPYGELPEIIWHPLQQFQGIGLHSEDIIVIGPGLGFDKWGQAAWNWVKNIANPTVADAGALHYLAKDALRRNNWIITPHPGEAAQLLGMTVACIQKDRCAAIKALHSKYHSSVVLKGFGSLVLGANNVIKACPYGNPGMAAPGMGDVLSGLIAGCMAQIANIEDAANLAVGLHALAGDAVMQQHPAMIVRPKILIKQLQNHMQDLLFK